MTPLFRWWSVIAVIMSAADAMLLKRPSSSRYFTKDGTLPPLVSLAAAARPSNDTLTIPYSKKKQGRSSSDVSVVYTNDPGSVYRWLSDHLPYEGCTIGFDTEVSVFIFY